VLPPFSEAEIQVLIAVIELTDPIETPNNYDYSFFPGTPEEAARYFRKYRLDWTDAIATLTAAGLLRSTGPGVYALSAEGEAHARILRIARPPIYYWYREFYEAVAHSPTHALYCERLFGRNLCQDGFAEVDHLHTLVAVTPIRAGERVLDLGCGNGLIAEYLAGLTGAEVWGVDYIPEAIRDAQERTVAKRDRLDFRVGNLDRLEYPPNSFDVLISVDTLYMPNDLAATVGQMKSLLKPGGRMAVFYSHALWENPAYTAESLRPDRTPLGEALRLHGLLFQTWNFTQADYAHALKKKHIVESLQENFEQEGNRFLYENKIATAEGVAHAIETGTHVRYLYRVTLQPE
jgi:SAM-dependent methyltransferase